MTEKTPPKPKSVKAKPKSVKKPAAKIPASEKPLTPQQEKFCQQVVLNGGDKSAAYRAAYPKSLKNKDESVNSMASRLYASVKVASRCAELQTKLAEKAEKDFGVDADYVLRRHVEIDALDVADILDDDGDIMPIRQWPKSWRQSISGIEMSELKAGKGDQETLMSVLKKIKWPDKVVNLKAMGTHVKVMAYREQLGISDPKGDTLKMISAQMSAEEAANLYKELISR